MEDSLNMDKYLQEERFEFENKPSVCPVCHSKRIANILYGLPAYTVDLRKALAEGRVTLGGCCIDDDSPRWQCVDCRRVFFIKH